MKTEKQYLTPEQVRTKIVEDYSYSTADNALLMGIIIIGVFTSVDGI